jgi:hypothetical protein
MSNEFSRRDVIRNLALGLVGTGMLDLEAAQHVHSATNGEKKANGVYKPKFFAPHQYSTLKRLAELIVPADEVSGSAVDAGAPEFIDLLCSQSQKLGDIYNGGLAWFDAEMRRRYNSSFVEAPPASQTAFLDALIAAEQAERKRQGETVHYERGANYREFSSYATQRPSDLAPGVLFFDWVRKMTVDAFYTSPIGVKDLDFRGNRSYSKYEVPVESLQYALSRSPFKS